MEYIFTCNVSGIDSFGEPIGYKLKIVGPTIGYIKTELNHVWKGSNYKCTNPSLTCVMNNNQIKED